MIGKVTSRYSKRLHVLLSPETKSRGTGFGAAVGRSPSARQEVGESVKGSRENAGGHWGKGNLVLSRQEA